MTPENPQLRQSETSEERLRAVKQLLTSALVLLDKERARIPSWVISDIEDALAEIERELGGGDA